MKWIKLTDKEPKFGEKYLLLNEHGEWWKGILKGVHQVSLTDKTFDFSDENGDSGMSVTHYMKIELPK